MIPTLERRRQGNQDLKLILSYIAFPVFEASVYYL